MMKKILCVLLMLAMLLCVVACTQEKIGDDGKNDRTQATVGSDGGENGGEEEAATTLTFEERLAGLDYNAAEATIMAQGTGADEQFASNYNCHDLYVTQTGDSISQAVFDRMIAVQEFLNIKLVVDYNSDAAGTLSNLVKTGDSTYDMAIISLRSDKTDALDIAIENALYNLRETTYVDLDKPYWDNNASKTFTVNNKCYVGIGDITLQDEMLAGAMVYSKQHAIDYGVGDINAYVKNGTWTLEVMQEMMKKVGYDADYNGLYDENDMYGYLGEQRTIDQFWFAAGETMTHFNEDGTMYVDVLGDRSVSILQDLCEMINRDPTFHYAKGDGGGSDYEWFKQGKGLFQTTTVRPIVAQLRTSTVDYGIIPFPKYETTQPQYYTYQNPANVLSGVIPTSCSDVDFSSAVMESLAYSGVSGDAGYSVFQPCLGLGVCR